MKHKVYLYTEYKDFPEATEVSKRYTKLIDLIYWASVIIGIGLMISEGWFFLIGALIIAGGFVLAYLVRKKRDEKIQNIISSIPTKPFNGGTN